MFECFISPGGKKKKEEGKKGGTTSEQFKTNHQAKAQPPTTTVVLCSCTVCTAPLDLIVQDNTDHQYYPALEHLSAFYHERSLQKKIKVKIKRF
jgi:hypothetical protein